MQAGIMSLKSERHANSQAWIPCSWLDAAMLATIDSTKQSTQTIWATAASLLTHCLTVPLMPLLLPTEPSCMDARLELAVKLGCEDEFDRGGFDTA